MSNIQTWNNKQGNRDRKAWLLVVTADAVTAFAGEHIPGKLAVIGEQWTKDGKWSNSTFRLQVADGVRLIAGHDGWETGTFAEGVASAIGGGAKPPTNWAEMAGALGVSVDAAKAFLGAWRPKAAAKLTATEAAVAGLGKPAPDAAPKAISLQRLVNLTPHQVVVVDAAGRPLWTFSPEATPARVEQTRAIVGETSACNSIPVYRPAYGQVTGLPDAQWGVGLIVSALVRMALPNRRDLFSPGELVRDADGKVIGCRGLDGNL